ncbi:MAG: hypothetical protein ABR536_05320 [Solirubrobacterales bacterium]
MAENHSIEVRLGRRLGRAVRGMGPSERLASIGALAVFLSMLLPWYRSPIEADLVQTGAGAFNFALAALLLTMAAVLFLAVEVGAGYRPPRPLSIGTLLIGAGVWGGLIAVFEMLDRPQFHFGGVNDDYDIAYGTFVAVAGTVVITVAGIRRRAREIIARHGPAQIKRQNQVEEKEGDDE